MKFTVISHACLYIEHENTRLLIDPWILGSCYWRSWWNYPEPDESLIKNIEPTHIYITHLHWDHYHGPSLRKLEKFDPIIIFPKHFNKRLLRDCQRDFKFNKILEIDHGKKFKLEKELFITSYQFNPFFIDSALVVESKEYSILNVNDCKVFGLSLKQIINNHKRFEFVFRSHSSASPIPHCIEGSNPEISARSPLAYAKEFSYFSEKTNAKYAVPFASSHYFLHKDTEKFNKYYSDPSFVAKTHSRLVKTDQKCILMPSSSSWSKEKGLEIFQHDYSKLKDHIIEGTKRHEKSLKKRFESEKTIKLNKKAFHEYFKFFLRSNDFIFNFKFTFGFLINEVKTNSKLLCLVNGKNKKTSIIEISPNEELKKFNLSFVISCPIYVFNDCNLKNMYNTFTPSKLLKIYLFDKKANKNVNKIFNLLDLYENDCLPSYKLATFRNLEIIIRRWREFFDILSFIIIIKIMRKELKDLYLAR